MHLCVNKIQLLHQTANGTKLRTEHTSAHSLPFSSNMHICTSPALLHIDSDYYWIQRNATNATIKMLYNEMQNWNFTTQNATTTFIDSEWFCHFVKWNSISNSNVVGSQRGIHTISTFNANWSPFSLKTP